MIKEEGCSKCPNDPNRKLKDLKRIIKKLLNMTAYSHH